MAILTHRCCTPYTSPILSKNVVSEIWHLVCFSNSDWMFISIFNISTILLLSGEVENNDCHSLVARCKKRKLPRVNSLLALERKTFWLPKNSTGVVGKILRGLELGRSTVFLRKQRRGHKNCSLVDIPSIYFNQFVATEKKQKDAENDNNADSRRCSF